MTGSLLWHPDDSGRHPHDRVVFVRTRGELRYRDLRKLRGIRLGANDEEVDRVVGLLSRADVLRFLQLREELHLGGGAELNAQPTDAQEKPPRGRAAA